MNYEILSLKTVKDLQNYKKLQNKYNKLKQAYEELLKEIKRRDENEK